jgi:hypothetical protein
MVHGFFIPPIFFHSFLIVLREEWQNEPERPQGIQYEQVDLLPVFFPLQLFFCFLLKTIITENQYPRELFIAYHPVFFVTKVT